MNNQIETKPAVKQDSSITSIANDLKDQASNFGKINNKVKMDQLLDLMVSKLDPDFKKSAGFKQAVIAFYNKHK